MSDPVDALATPEEPADWRYILCPMPVLRAGYEHGEDDEHWTIRQETCGEELCVEYDDGESLLAHGPTGGEYLMWKVACRLGHVIVLPDHEGNDVGTIPLDWPKVRGLLADLGVTYRDV